MVSNRSLVLLQEPTGMPQVGKDIDYRTSDIDIESAPSNGLILKTVAIAIDPTLRNTMRLSNPKPYAPLYKKGDAMWGYGLSEVVVSGNAGWKKGDILMTPLTKMSTYWRLEEEELNGPSKAGYKKIDPLPDLNVTTYLGALGMPGMTAYMSIKDIIGDFKPDSKLFVTSGAGFVGSLVCQIAKQAGVKVIASAGSEDKVAFLREKLGVDKAFNYKTADIDAELASFGGEEGIDYLYDNVGGKQLNSFLAHSAVHGVVVVCGAISAYNASKDQPAEVISNFPMAVLGRQLTVRGFIVASLYPRWEDSFWKEMPKMVQDGKLKSQEDVRVGMDALAGSFEDLLTGKHQGKLIVLVDEEQKGRWIQRNPDGFA